MVSELMLVHSTLFWIFVHYTLLWYGYSSHLCTIGALFIELPWVQFLLHYHGCHFHCIPFDALCINSLCLHCDYCHFLVRCTLIYHWCTAYTHRIASVCLGLQLVQCTLPYCKCTSHWHNHGCTFHLFDSSDLCTLHCITMGALFICLTALICAFYTA